MKRLLKKYWKEYEGGLITIVEMLAAILIYFSLCSVDIVSYGLFALAMGGMLFNLFRKIQYRNGNTDYLRIPTKNDTYSKMTNFTLGIGLIVAGVGFAIIDKPKLYVLILAGIGIIVLLNGIYDLPKCEINIIGNLITIRGFETPVDVRLLKKFEILADRILITDIDGKFQRVDNLEIDYENGEKIRTFILKKITYDGMLIVNNAPNNAIAYSVIRG